MKLSFSNAGVPEESSSSLLSSVFLLVLSYGLVLGAPLALSALRAVPAGATDLGKLPPWMLSGAAASLGLGGVSIMVFMMLKLVPSLEHHPYASLAAALGTLLGVMLLGLNATIRVSLFDAEAIAFLCLVTSILGGGFAQRGYGLTALLGIFVATLPPMVVLLAVWAQSGFSHDVVSVLGELSTADRTFLAVLTASGVLLSIVAVVARSLAIPVQPHWYDEEVETYEDSAAPDSSDLDDNENVVPRNSYGLLQGSLVVLMCALTATSA